MTPEDAFRAAAAASRFAGEPAAAELVWREVAEDQSRPSPVRDLLCWMVSVTKDGTLTGILYLADATGEVVDVDGIMS